MTELQFSEAQKNVVCPLLHYLIGEIGKVTNMTNVALATPFAFSVLLPPEVWNAVFTLIKLKN